MTTANFRLTPQTFTYVQYDDTLTVLQTELQDLAGGGVRVYQDADDATRVLIFNGDFACVAHQDQWIGYNFGGWDVQDDGAMSGAGNGQGFTPVD